MWLEWWMTKQNVCKGADMEYMKAKHPLYDKESLVTEGFHVTLG